MSTIDGLQRRLDRLIATYQEQQLDAECPPGCVCVAEADFSEDDLAFLHSLFPVDASGKYTINTREMSDAQVSDLKAFALRLKAKEQAV